MHMQQRMALGTSNGGEALGPEKAKQPSVGECQDREIGVGGLVSRGRRERLGDFWVGGYI